MKVSNPIHVNKEAQTFGKLEHLPEGALGEKLIIVDVVKQEVDALLCIKNLPVRSRLQKSCQK